MLPTSQQFDVFDWNARADSSGYGTNIASLSAGALSAGFSAGAVFYDNNSVAVAAVAEGAPGTSPITAEFQAPWNSTVILDSFTFEVEFTVGAYLPTSFSDPASRVFIGINNPAGYGFGLLVSSKGLAVASAKLDPKPVPLHGSGALVYSDDGTPKAVVVRGVVSDGRLAIYTADASEAYDTLGGPSWWLHPNLDLRYNVPALQTPGDTASGLLLYCSAQTAAGLSAKFPSQNLQGETAIVLIKSLRLSTTALLPTERPLASIAAAMQVLLRTATVLDGSESRDKYGAAISYAWEIEQAPVGSTAKLQGSSLALVDTSGATSTTGDVVVVYGTPTGKANALRLKIWNPGVASQSLAAEFSNGTLYVRVGTDVHSIANTTALDLQSSLYGLLCDANDEDTARLFSVYLAYPTSTGLGLLREGDYTFSGGAGSTLATPMLFVDVPGMYSLSLVVNNGTRNSLKATHAFLAMATDNLVGRVQDADYIFKYLPDFWNMVENKAQISDAWSAVAQLVSADMLNVWQNAFSRHLKDISRKYRRHWLSFDSSVDMPAPSIVSVANYRAQLGGTGLGSDVGMFTEPVAYAYTYAPPAELPTPCLALADSWPGKVTRLVSCTAGQGNWKLTFSSEGVPVSKPITTGTDGRFVYDALCTDPAKSRLVKSGTADLSAVGSASYLRWPGYSNSTTTEVVGGTKHLRLLPLDAGAAFAHVIDGLPFVFDVVQQVQPTIVLKPFLQFDATVDLTAFSLEIGDCISVTFKDPYTQDGVVVHLPIEAFDSTVMFVAWEPAVAALNALAIESQDARIWTEADVLGLACTFMQFHYCQSLLPEQDLEHVPYLGHNTIDFTLLENKHYRVRNSQIEFLPAVTGQVHCSGTTVASGLGQFDFTAGMALRVLTGPVGVYKILERHADGAVVLDRPLLWNSSINGTVTADVLRYSYANVPPVRFWAELSFFDNWRSVENTFGLAVGVPKKYLTDRGVATSYLDIVKSLCYAFMHTSTATTLQMVANTIAGYGFVGEASQIIYVEYPAEGNGTVVLRNKFQQDYTLTFPRNAIFSINPKTGRTYKAHEYLDNGTGTGEDYADSQVDPFSSIFDISRVVDYVSDPTRAALEFYGSSEPKKYSTFIVDVPLDITRNTYALGVVKELFKELRSANTDFVIYGTLGLSDEFQIHDTLKKRVTLKPKDTLNSTSVVSSSMALAAQYAWPYEGVEARGWDISEGLERYESGYQDGVLDDYSGDGSWNAGPVMADQSIGAPVLDQVNALDGDYDFTKSTVMVWVKVLSTAVEFKKGEGLELRVDGVNVLPPAVVLSPPTVKFVGSGFHPKIPFMYAPQVQHPNTYIVLGFDIGYYGHVFNNGGGRFDAVGRYCNLLYPNDTKYLVGIESGAVAQVVFFPEREYVAHAKYFEMVPLFGLDKLLEADPESRSEQILSFYVPNAGCTIAEAIAHTKMLDGSQPESYRTKKAFQQLVLDNPFVPSTSTYVPRPGNYTEWAGTVGADPYVLDYSYTDEATKSLLDQPTGTFAQAGDPVVNMHVTLHHLNRKGRHYSHGETFMRTIPPRIEALQQQDGWDAYIEGWNFISPDQTMGVITPTADPSTFNGSTCGSWVFFRNSVTHEEVSATGVSFYEGTGYTPTGLVLGASSAVQTRTGHILVATAPAGMLSAGMHDIIVRNYYKYKYTAGGQQYCRMEEHALLAVFEVLG